MVTEYRRSFFHQMGLPDIAWYTVIVMMHTAMPSAMASTMSAVRPGLRPKLLSARRR
jgi:hypothetical protein